MTSRPAYLALASERYAVAVTAVGGGFSCFDEHVLGTWRADPVESLDGFNLYVRDLDNGEFWTVSGVARRGRAPGEVAAQADGIRIRRSESGIDSVVTVSVIGAANAEVRRCELTNGSGRRRRLDITSYLEVALNRPAAHESHPAFSKLFVQTQRAPEIAGVVATRRPRGHGETSPVLAHALLDAPLIDFTTDRAAFVGRGRGALDPLGMTGTASLGEGHGNVLDPCVVLRTRVELDANATCSVRFVLTAADSRERAVAQIAHVREADTQDSTTTGAASARSSERVQQLAVGLEPLATASPEQRGGAGSHHLPPVLSAGATITDPARLEFFNGHGGFAAAGREYVIRMPLDASGRHLLPPAPWTNVIANPRFGCIVSETGAGTTWSRNSREHRLTPWSNDPLSDPHGDAIYVRDEATGRFWSPTPGPCPPTADIEARHGFGYTTWSTVVDGIAHETTVFVPSSDTVRITRVRLTNLGKSARRVSLYAYNRWVLGGVPEATRASVRAQFSPPLQAVLARNDAAIDAFRCVAFAASDRPTLADCATDRAEFLGVPGSTADPAALRGDGSLRAGAGTDPCAVLRVALDVPAGETREASFLLGTGDDEAAVGALLEKYRRADAIGQELKSVTRAWTDTTSRVAIDTPSRALDVMINGWLPYQDIGCRIWGRSAFYQSGGAFGYRDQLQDAASIVLLRPDFTRSQILLHAAHQFVEGDVLHWWHPPHEVGLRTRFADDLLWLPWITAYYVSQTGDRAILDEIAPFVTARALADDEAEVFLQAQPSEECADVYEHCCRAIDRSLSRGVHGLPFFGAGDWNDGMNRVGHHGRGESVWMGFFLVKVIDEFVPFCAARGDAVRATRYRAHRDALHAALNTEGWDGDWYRRGWYDNGAVLGSHASDECRIDALAQAWAVISGVASTERAMRALDSLEKHLVDDEARIIRLLTPPFVDTPNDPGYIRGYVAGVRENGGQYTHAAIWVVRAMAEAGRRDRAAELLDLLLPIEHSRDAAAAQRYKVEPYVIAADVYGAEPHVGRGGWTWYTGSAGWLYRVALESILGLRIDGGNGLVLEPRIPDAWDGFTVRYRVDDSSTVLIRVRNPERRAARVARATLCGTTLDLREGVLRCELPRAAGEHILDVVLGG